MSMYLFTDIAARFKRLTPTQVIIIQIVTTHSHLVSHPLKQSKHAICQITSKHVIKSAVARQTTKALVGVCSFLESNTAMMTMVFPTDPNMQMKRQINTMITLSVIEYKSSVSMVTPDLFPVRISSFNKEDKFSELTITLPSIVTKLNSFALIASVTVCRMYTNYCLDPKCVGECCRQTLVVSRMQNVIAYGYRLFIMMYIHNIDKFRNNTAQFILEFETFYYVHGASNNVQ